MDEPLCFSVSHGFFTPRALPIHELAHKFRKKIMSLSPIFNAVNSPFITTSELASVLRCKPRTVHQNFCMLGHHHGLRPVKQPSGRLLWLKSEVQSYLENSGVKA